MSNTIAIEKSRQGKRHAVEKIYERYPMNQPFEASDGDLADRFRISRQDVRNARADLIAIGAAQVERSGFGLQKKTTWTLTTPGTVTLARLEAKWRKDDEHTHELLRGKNPAKGIHRSDPRFREVRHERSSANGNGLHGATPEHPVLPDTLVASTGPEPVPVMKPSLAGARHDEPRALVEATRQYATTQRELDNKIKELEALGVVVDRTKLAAAINAPTDHQLVVVARVMPYIEQLERANARHEETIADLRRRVADMPGLRDENRRLSDQNKRLVGDNATLRTQLQNRETPIARATGPNAAAPVG